MFFFHLIKVWILIKRRPGEHNWMNKNWVELPMNVQTVRYGKNDALRYKRYVIFMSHADWTLELSIPFLTHNVFRL